MQCSFWNPNPPVESELCLRSVFPSLGDLAPQDGGLLPDDALTEVVKPRRPFTKGAGGRPRAYKVKTPSRFPSSLPVFHLIKPGPNCIFGKKNNSLLNFQIGGVKNVDDKNKYFQITLCPGLHLTFSLFQFHLIICVGTNLIFQIQPCKSSISDFKVSPSYYPSCMCLTYMFYKL